MTESHARLLGAECSDHGAHQPVVILGLRPDTWGLVIACGVALYAFSLLWGV